MEHVDPTKEGWLMERWKKNEKPSCIPAPVNQFKGDPDTKLFGFLIVR